MSTRTGDRTWSLTLVRAIPAAVVALLITFLADHSAILGFFALGGFALATGIVVLIAALRGAYPTRPFAIHGGLLIAGGAVALTLNQSGLPVLLFLTSALFGATGIVELVTGLRARGVLPAARDWIFVGALSAVLAIAVLLIPADFREVFPIPGTTVPPLTASVILVGLIGAYAAVVAVYLVIAGLSLKWAQHPSAIATEA